MHLEELKAENEPEKRAFVTALPFWMLSSILQFKPKSCIVKETNEIIQIGLVFSCVQSRTFLWRNQRELEQCVEFTKTNIVQRKRFQVFRHW